MKNVMKKIGLILAIILLIWLVLMFIYSLIYKITGLYKEEYLFNTRNLKVIIAEDDIMYPEIKKNDIVIIKSLKSDQTLEVGNNIYLQDGQMRKLSKIEAIKEEKNEKIYITKGIKNYYYNPNNSKNNDIVGKVVKVTKIGSLSFRIAKSNIFTLISIVIIIVLIVQNIRRDNKRKKRREKKVRKEEIKEDISF